MDLQSIASVRIDPSTFEKTTGAILASAIEVHRMLGPGLLESIYLTCLYYELTSRKLRFVVQRAIPIVYKGIPLDACYRIDLLVEDLVVVEVKSVDCPAGLLINFNVPRLMDGVKRLINPSARGREG